MGWLRRALETLAIGGCLPVAVVATVVGAATRTPTPLLIAGGAWLPALAGAASVQRRWGVGIAALARTLTVGLVGALGLAAAGLLAVYAIRINHCGDSSPPESLARALDVVAALAYAGVTFAALRSAARTMTLWPLAVVSAFLCLLPLSAIWGGGCD